MATRYVGIGGNDGNSGLTWALRKLTLNGAEDTPVVAGDDVYVGPGVYRETLTLDVAGNAANPITYIADVTGEHTDSVGGVVRITGTDNDQSSLRNNVIDNSPGPRDYRTFRGFRFDGSASHCFNYIGGGNVIEDCSFLEIDTIGIYTWTGADITDTIHVRRCLFIGQPDAGITLQGGGGADRDIDILIENCIFIGGGYSYGILLEDIGDVNVRNCLFIGTAVGIRCPNTLAAVTANNVNNCIFYSNITAVEAAQVGDVVENYNAFYENSTDRTLVNVGAQSNTYMPVLSMPLLHSGVSQGSGFKFPWWFGELSEWSQIQAITGSNEPTEDLRGIARPVTASKNSWGPCQFFDAERETGTKRTGSVSIALHDAGRHQIWVPVTNTSTTIKVYVYREANHAGNLPQMIIKQPGQADDVTTDTLAHSQWNLLTTTLTPAADPPYVVIELVSRNTAAALAYEVFFDDLDVS